MGISGEQEGIRRCGITELPNCIMQSIVSLLPLKDAVETVLVSPQWRHLSHPILTRPNLEFDYFNVLGSSHSTRCDPRQKKQDFVRRVSKYLQQYEGNKVDSFKINGYLTAEWRAIFDKWTRWAITKGVEELHLRLGKSFSLRDDDYVFPNRSLVGSALYLKHLLLENCILRAPPTDFNGFNRLTTLRLYRVSLNQCLMTNLFSVCLLLESLTLYRCWIMGCLYLSFDPDPFVACNCLTDPDRGTMRRSLNIVAGDRLTDLKVLHCEEGTKMEISAPNLASLEYSDPYGNYNFRFFSIQTPRLSRIYFSDMRVRETLLPQALIQFALCPGLETLHLVMPAQLPRIGGIPTYGNLKQLNLDIDLYGLTRRNKDDVDVYCVLDLLKAAPLLEELVILVFRGDHLSETNPRETRNHSGFTNDHLKMVKMQGFRGKWYETELAICILENTPKLEMLVIDQLGKLYLGNGKFSDPLENYLEQHMGVVEEKLNGVKTDAQIKFL